MSINLLLGLVLFVTVIAGISMSRGKLPSGGPGRAAIVVARPPRSTDEYPLWQAALGWLVLGSGTAWLLGFRFDGVLNAVRAYLGS